MTFEASINLCTVSSVYPDIDPGNVSVMKRQHIDLPHQLKIAQKAQLQILNKFFKKQVEQLTVTASEK